MTGQELLDKFGAEQMIEAWGAIIDPMSHRFGIGFMNMSAVDTLKLIGSAAILAARQQERELCQRERNDLQEQVGALEVRVVELEAIAHEANERANALRNENDRLRRRLAELEQSIRALPRQAQ